MSRPDPENRPIAWTLSLIPASMLAAWLMWNEISPAWAFAAPAVAAMLAHWTACAVVEQGGELRFTPLPKPRNVAWLALALQAAIMLALLLEGAQ